MIRQAIRNPRGFFGSRWRMLVRNLLYPERYYEEHVKNYGLKWEFVTLLLVGAVGSVGMYVAVQTILEEFALGADAVIQDRPPMDESTARQLRARALYPLIGMFVLWAYYTLVYYAGSWFFSGHGTIFKTLKNTAWALVPYAIANVVFAAAVAFTFTTQELETDLPGLPENNVQYLITQGMTEVPMIAALLVQAVVAVWIAYIGAAAIQDAMGVDRERALQIAGAASALHVAYLLWEIVGRAGVV